MLRQNPNRTSTNKKRSPNNTGGGNDRRTDYGEARGETRLGGIDIQRELNKLEEMILDSIRVPLSRLTLVDEEQLLDQLDLVRLNLPAAFQEAIEITTHREDVLMEAEQIAQDIISTAEQRAAQILDEISLIRQAEAEAQRIRQQVQQECDAMEQQTLADIEQVRRRAQQELEEMQRAAIAECEEIQRGADDYADRTLRDMEDRLGEMMRIIRNGRQQVQGVSRSPEPEGYSSNRLPPAGGRY
jgi:F0F1-type ATP synthase membrane subunit b/b'